jgi:HlyD family secretion protein
MEGRRSDTERALLYDRGMRRWSWRLGAVLAAVVLALVVYVVALRPAPVPVTIFVAAKGRVEESVTNSKAGTIKARRRARLSPEIGGRVAEVLAQKGERVAAGTVLLRLDDTQYRAELENAERALDAGRKSEREVCLGAEQAERDLQRAERLANDEILSVETIDQTRTRRDAQRAACDAARARARQLESQVKVARSELEKTVLRAPFDGVIAELDTEKGEWITPSPPGIPMPAVIDLIDTDSIYLSAPLDEVDRAKVSLGQPVRITMDAYPGKSFPGKVTRIAPYILDLAEQSRTFEVEATFDDADFARTLPPGASADVEIILEGKDGVLRIPSYALIEGRRALVLESCGGSGSLLDRWLGFLVDTDEGCLVSRNVTTGLKNWEFVEITSGLSEGDRVVVSLDRAEVKEGARARQSAVAER